MLTDILDDGGRTEEHGLLGSWERGEDALEVGLEGLVIEQSIGLVDHEESHPLQPHAILGAAPPRRDSGEGRESV